VVERAGGDVQGTGDLGHGQLRPDLGRGRHDLRATDPRRTSAVGEPEPAGRPPAEPTAGFWWLYAPLRFERFAVVIIAQEDPDGYRALNDAVRVWPDGRVEQLGWPRVEIDYRPGTRGRLRRGVRGSSRMISGGSAKFSRTARDHRGVVGWVAVRRS